jgi:hypothetical protein
MIARTRHTELQDGDELVWACAAQSIEGKDPFMDVPERTHAAMGNFSRAELERLLDPSIYIGLSPDFTAAVASTIARAEYAS